jgi:hypothetical protein
MTPKPKDKPAGKVKCTLERCCPVMVKNINHESRRGLNGVTTINTMTGETRDIGIRYCLTAKSNDKGVMLNFCPWCGANLQWWESSK